MSTIARKSLICLLWMSACALLVAQQPDQKNWTQAIENGDFSAAENMAGWAMRGEQLGAFQLVKPQDEGALPILAITVEKTSARAWTMELWQSIKKAVPKGSTMYISFDYKMSPGYSFQFYWQQETEPWPKLLSLRLTEPSENWRTVRVAVPVHTEFAAEKTAFSFHLAEKIGVLQLRKISAMIVPADIDPESLETNVTAVLGGDFHDNEWREKVVARLEKVRKVPVRVVAHRGEEKAKDVKVTLSQTARPFPFGVECQGALLKPELLQNANLQKLAPRVRSFNSNLGAYKDKVLDDSLFRFVTFTDALVWRENDLWGANTDAELVKMVREAGLSVRGRALLSPAYRYMPEKCRGQNGDALRKMVLEHVRQMCRRHQGTLEAWEVVHGGQDYNELYKAIGLESLSECFQIAREIEPQAKLLLSDRQALTAISEDPMLDMLELADWLVNTCGVKIDGLVLSANLRRLDVGPQSMETRLDRIASQLTDIPIHISGLAVNTDEEDLQGDMLRDYMLLFYSHPAVASVSLGELWDAAQLSPKMGWYHGDFTEHPSLGIIRKLLDDDWRTNSVLATNEEGVASGNCFIGDYRVTVSSEGEEERQITFSLPPLAGRADGKIAVQRDGVTVTHTKDATVIDVKVE
ncbi:MAG: endo-1,4-beta-xylanase [Victivallales bacterium]|nr:endo-1,4-beta-xylanase [Victivallales bacterium]